MLKKLVIIDIRTGSCGGFQWPNYETQPCYTSGLMIVAFTANCAVTGQRAAPAQPLVRGGGLIERPAAKLVQGPRPTPIVLLTFAVWNGCLQRGSVHSLEYAWAVYAIAPLSRKWAIPHHQLNGWHPSPKPRPPRHRQLKHGMTWHGMVWHSMISTNICTGSCRGFQWPKKV